MTSGAPTVVAAQRVLVVDDDSVVSDVVGRYLVRAGFVTQLVVDGAVALRRALADPPDLVVLDLMLPGLDGLEVFRRLREVHPVPVVMLTASGEEADRLLGLELGADDYVTKPFSPRELVLRVRAVLRRVQAAPAPRRVRLGDGDLAVDVLAHEVMLGGTRVSMTSREFDLLAFLLEHPREAFSRAELLRRVWGWEYGDVSTVTVHVRRLREKVERDPHLPRRIVTVLGIGYRYEPEPDAP